MRELLDKSSLLRWAYRLALIASTMGLLYTLNIAYVDWLNGWTESFAAGAALGLSSVVLGVSTILASRLRRRSKDLCRRQERLERNVDKIAKYVQVLPKNLEKKIMQQTQNRLEEAIQEVKAAASPKVDPQEQVEDPRVQQLQKTLEQTLHLLCSQASANGKLADYMEMLAGYENLMKELQALGREEWMDRLRQKIGDLENRTQNELRQKFVESLRARQWSAALEVGMLIQRSFPDSPMSRHFAELRPKIDRKLQDKDDSGHPAEIEPETQGALLSESRKKLLFNPQEEEDSPKP